MKHKLEFVKISPQHEFAGVGFAGNIFITLGALTYLGTDDQLHVDMETNECCCTQEGEFLHETYNPWEYYFNQPSLLPNESYNHMTSLIPANPSGGLYYNNQNSFMDPSKFISLKEKFFKNFQIKEYLTKEIDDFYIKNIKNKHTLGVQVRLTDYTHNGHNFPPVESYIQKINKILQSDPSIEQIFLATDDGKIISTIEQSIPVPIIYWPGMFRADNKNLHLTPYERFKDTRDLHRYNLGVECMKEIFILSKCDQLLKAYTSSMSIIAVILSENLKTVHQLIGRAHV